MKWRQAPADYLNKQTRHPMNRTLSTIKKRKTGAVSPLSGLLPRSPTQTPEAARRNNGFPLFYNPSAPSFKRYPPNRRIPESRRSLTSEEIESAVSHPAPLFPPTSNQR